MHGSIDRPPPPISTRRGQIYAFICDELAQGRPCPSLPEIARHFQFSVARAKQLVDQLIAGGWIMRGAGAQRALIVPGAALQIATQLLRAQGYRVDDAARSISGPLPDFKLPMLPALPHIPDPIGPDPIDDGGTAIERGYGRRA